MQSNLTVHGKPKTSKWKVGLGIGFVILTAAITGALVIYIRSKKCRKEGLHFNFFLFTS